MTSYLDCNATSPIEPAVAELVLRYLQEEYGNAGSRTHEFGLRAKRAVETARKQVAAVVQCDADEVFFTSGATESDNLAILGLEAAASREGRRHVLSAGLEHKAVLEPLEQLGERGFEVELIPVGDSGWVDPEDLKAALRPDTFLVSLMHVNNETGIRQPVADYAEVLAQHPAYLHVDAAQGFGKDIDALRSPRIDLISISGHKIYGPKGIGALIARRRGFERPPLQPLMFGGGQERGIRPGTQPVALIAGLGMAAELALQNHESRAAACLSMQEECLRALEPIGAQINGDPERLMSNAVSLSFPGLDSEAVMLTLKDLAAVSNGSACTSHSYQPSHVLQAMGLSEDQINGAVRLSWCHLTEPVAWEEIASRIQSLLPLSPTHE